MTDRSLTAGLCGNTVHRAGRANTRLSFIDLKYGLSSERCKYQQLYMAAQSNVNLEKCALFRCLCGVWKLNSSALAAGQMEVPVCSPLKYSKFGHTDKSRARKIASPTSRGYCVFQSGYQNVSRPARRATLNTGLWLPRNVPSKLRARVRTLLQPRHAEEIMCRSHAKISWENHLIECQ